MGADNGLCNSTHARKPTSFHKKVASYNRTVLDLNPYIHPYIVFGNSGTMRPFNPRDFGIEPLSVVAVVCNKTVGLGVKIYGIWGDERKDSGDKAYIGEASLSLAQACYGNVRPGKPHTDTDVLYIAFNGTEAVPGANGAKWDAESYDEFADSIDELGDKLVSRFPLNIW
ncbi:glycoside hydrolase family 75 protein [Camillea tinctor]|nr:glycoside hydrolase family 75 protein [Camillea tinctor]